MTTGIEQNDYTMTTAIEPLGLLLAERDRALAAGPAVDVVPWVAPANVVLKRILPHGVIEFHFRKEREVRPTRNLLSSFCALTFDSLDRPGYVESNSERVMRFASAYGPLGLCKAHCLPASHTGTGSSLCPINIKRHRALSVVREPWAGWNRYSRLAAAIVGLLVAGGPADVQALRAITGRDDPREVILTWLNWCRINFWLDENMRLDFYTVPSLFGYLGIQLALVAAGRRGVAVCAGCVEFFSPKRQPTPGRRSYCTKKTCQLARWRDAQRDHRAGGKAR
jgi:hypothetical protein